MTVINLRTVRKRRAKADAAKQADANRIAHGLSATQRDTARTTKEGLARHVDAHKLDMSDKP